MSKEKIWAGFSTILGLVMAILFFFNFNLESWVHDDMTPVNLEVLAENPGISFTGAIAGADIPHLSGAADLTDMYYGVDYATAEPLGIVTTNVYRLKPWANDSVTKRVNGRAIGAKERKAEILQSAWPFWDDYQPYYLLQLPDHSYILAQIPEAQAAALKRGKAVTLPLGQKENVPNTAQKYLAEICATYGVATDAVLYTWDDTWYEKHYFAFFILRFAVAAVLCFALSVGFILLGNKLLKIKST